MAHALSSPQESLPHILTLRTHGIYEDEHHRLWVVLDLQASHLSFSNRLLIYLTVYLQQGVAFPLESTPPSPMNLNGLPRRWTLRTMGTYEGTDNTFWRLLGHSQASVWYLKVLVA
uniref:Uncharacterized protein n=1 Tax=Rattus norvegicus TaxID=10116 RepID=A0ABK0LP73_RAT